MVCPCENPPEIFTELSSNQCQLWYTSVQGPSAPFFFSLFSFLEMNVRMCQNGLIAAAADEGRFLFWGSSLKLFVLFIKPSPGFGVGLEPLLQKVIQWVASQPDDFMVLDVGRLRKIHGYGPLCGLAPAVSCSTLYSMHALEPAG